MREFDEQRRASAEPVAQPEPASHAGRPGAASLSPGDVLRLQRQAGNRAVQQALAGRGAGTRGLRLGGDQGEPIRGRTAGEFVGDVARPIGTGLGNVVGGIAGALTGISVSSATNSGPAWRSGGELEWHVGFTTTGRSGWLVQEIKNTWRAEDASGAAVASPFTPLYYEAWAVDAAGAVTPAVGATNDMWDQPDLNATYGAAKGHWATKGKVYFTTVDPATQGFVANNPATNAGILLSSTTAPAALDLGIARLHRYAQGTWDSTAATPTHDGSAGP